MKKKVFDTFTVHLDQLVLVPEADNPNKMSDEDFELLVHSIGEVGFLQPILVRASAAGEDLWDVVDGNHRSKAARKAGLKEVSAVEWDGSDEMRVALQLGMNRLRGEVNLGMAAHALSTLAEAGWSASQMTLTGFSTDEIGTLLKSMQTDAEDVLAGSIGSADTEPAPPETAAGPFTLELKFASAEDMQRAKRALRRKAGKGRELGEGLLVLLDGED